MDVLTTWKMLTYTSNCRAHCATCVQSCTAFCAQQGRGVLQNCAALLRSSVLRRRDSRPPGPQPRAGQWRSAASVALPAWHTRAIEFVTVCPRLPCRSRYPHGSVAVHPRVERGCQVRHAGVVAQCLPCMVLATECQLAATGCSCRSVSGRA